MDDLARGTKITPKWVPKNDVSVDVGPMLPALEILDNNAAFVAIDIASTSIAAVLANPFTRIEDDDSETVEVVLVSNSFVPSLNKGKGLQVEEDHVDSLLDVREESTRQNVSLMIPDTEKSQSMQSSTLIQSLKEPRLSSQCVAKASLKLLQGEG